MVVSVSLQKRKDDCSIICLRRFSMFWWCWTTNRQEDKDIDYFARNF